MPLLYFIRHGQTDWNAQGRIQGELDPPINALGRLQAARNGGVLGDVIEDAARFDFVSSPLRRARETMEIIREKLGLPAHGYRTDDRLREVSFGDWGGLTLAECERAFPEDYARRLADIWGHRPPNGESLRELEARVLAWFSGLERDTVAVAHGGVSRCLRGHLLNLPPIETVHLDVPQDKVLMVEHSRITWL